MATPNFSALLPDPTQRELKALTSALGINRTQVVIRAIHNLYQQETQTMNEKHLTDNLWTERVGELRQMVSDLPEAPTCDEDVEYYLNEPEFFGGPEFDEADKTVLRREMRRQYPIE